MFQNPFKFSGSIPSIPVLVASFVFVVLSLTAGAQATLQWQEVTTDFGVLPASIKVYKTTDSIDGKPNLAYYVKANLKDKALLFTTDTSHGRRLTPQQFYEKNKSPYLIINTTFFSFATNQNLNAVIKDGQLVSHNVTAISGRGKDTLTYLHLFGSAIGLTKNRKADVAWLYTDSAEKKAFAMQEPFAGIRDSIAKHPIKAIKQKTSIITGHRGKTEPLLKKWKMETAVGGGPVLVQKGEVKITNEEERKFAGKAMNDKHPRTAMGYTNDGYLIFLVVQGRDPGTAEGVTLLQEAQMLKALGCVEALNLDGGGSSCLLINGKETIKPSDKVQRAVPAVFMIDKK